MDSPLDEPRRPRRRLRKLAAIFSATLLVAGLTAVLLGPTTASAAEVTFSQCNGVNNTPGLTTTCSVTVVNTLTDDPLTTGSVVTVNGVTGSFTNDIVTRVEQCNSSSRGGGGTLNCSVNIINNIATSGASAATTATISQCNGNQPDGLGTAPHTCSPVANTGTGATIFQCNNRTGNGGGLVNAEPLYSHCLASGTVSSSLAVTVNQCNEDAADGGGGQVHCTTSITTNVVDTSVTGGTGGPGGPGGGGTPVQPVTGAPNLTG